MLHLTNTTLFTKWIITSENMGSSKRMHACILANRFRISTRCRRDERHWQSKWHDGWCFRNEDDILDRFACRCRDGNWNETQTVTTKHTTMSVTTTNRGNDDPRNEEISSARNHGDGACPRRTTRRKTSTGSCENGSTRRYGRWTRRNDRVPRWLGKQKTKKKNTGMRKSFWRNYGCFHCFRFLHDRKRKRKQWWKNNIRKRGAPKKERRRHLWPRRIPMRISLPWSWWQWKKKQRK